MTTFTLLAVLMSALVAMATAQFGYNYGGYSGFGGGGLSKFPYQYSVQTGGSRYGLGSYGGLYGGGGSYGGSYGGYGNSFGGWGANPWGGYSTVSRYTSPYNNYYNRYY